MEPIRVPPDKKTIDLGVVNQRLVVQDTARPGESPTTFSVSLVGEHSQYFPALTIAPDKYWLAGTLSPMCAYLSNAGPSTLNVWIDATPEALGLRAEDEVTPGAALHGIRRSP
jgi:hypothetical protein